jgi:hypothetical protein
MDLFGRPAIHRPPNAPELSFPRHLSPVLRIVKPLPIVPPDKEADQPDPRREPRRRSRHAFPPLALAARTPFLARFRISCEVGIRDSIIIEKLLNRSPRALIFPTQMPLRLELHVDTYKMINCLYKGAPMKTNLKRKNYYLDERKIRRVRTILGAKTETEAIDAALNLVVFRKQILKSLEKVAGKGGVEKVF